MQEHAELANKLTDLARQQSSDEEEAEEEDGEECKYFYLTLFHLIFFEKPSFRNGFLCFVALMACPRNEFQRRDP